jgi:hypothetical protein
MAGFGGLLVRLRMLVAMTCVALWCVSLGVAFGSGGVLESVSLVASNADGSPDVLAGSHPFSLTSTIETGSSLTKDIRIDLPAGLVANTNVVAQCTTPQFDENLAETFNGCPANTAIGVVSAVLAGGAYPAPVFNLTPSPGEPIRLGFTVGQVPVIIDTSVRTGQDYGAVVSINNISQLLGFNGATVTLWGVPGEPAHNHLRGWNCVFDAEVYFEEAFPCVSPEDPSLTPFLTLPSACAGPGGLRVTANADTWLEPGVFPKEGVSFAPAQGLSGCNRMRFEPTISVAPDGVSASSPTGLNVGVFESQEGALSPTGISASDVKNITVKLPVGVSVNPSGANGLDVCTNAQIGFTGINPQTGTPEFTPDVPSCPDASKVSTVKITSPLLPNAVEGAVYLAAPQNFKGALENPFGSLIAAYIVAQDPVSGVLLKLPGEVTTDPVTGQLTASFQAPQLPFEKAEFKFFGGARAPLSTPPDCSTFETSTSIVPWSGTEAVSPSSKFQITSGPDGTGCPSPRPFAPEFQAGTTNIQAGAFTPFTLTMTRPDADQTLSRIEMNMPPGLLGSLSKVALCPEPQASKGECGPESLIGQTIVSAGLGTDPYTVTGGKVYITTGYDGAPYGLTIVNPATAGPFVLEEGRPVIVRAAIHVDPHTAALRIVSDPLPTILDGIPLQIQHVNVTIERPGGFVTNPTNCSKLAITGTLTSTENATAAVSTPFQVTDCAALTFAPKLTATTNGRTSKRNGASLDVTLARPTAGAGEANISEVKVDLPKQLPSRLSTLQKACTAAQFAANPAGCPAASIVAHAKVNTPILPVPLEGPGYFVSHGGEAFPNLVFILKGYGTTIEITAQTQIKKGVTSLTFFAAPDAPFTKFEVTSPQGPDSALAAFGNLCKAKLTMPTYYKAQNGTETHTTTPIKTTKCPTPTKHHRKK